MQFLESGLERYFYTEQPLDEVPDSPENIRFSDLLFTFESLQHLLCRELFADDVFFHLHFDLFEFVLRFDYDGVDFLPTSSFAAVILRNPDINKLLSVIRIGSSKPWRPRLFLRLSISPSLSHSFTDFYVADLDLIADLPNTKVNPPQGFIIILRKSQFTGMYNC
jgi:hypothetical protein